MIDLKEKVEDLKIWYHSLEHHQKVGLKYLGVFVLGFIIGGLAL